MHLQPKKWGRYVLLAIAIVFVFKNPAAAGELASDGMDLLGQGADALSTFAEHLN